MGGILERRIVSRILPETLKFHTVGNMKYRDGFLKEYPQCQIGSKKKKTLLPF